MQPHYLRSNQQIAVRPLTSDDTETFFDAVRKSVESLTYWRPWCGPDYSREDAANWTAHCETAWSAKTDFPLGIFDVPTGQIVGGTGINQINRANGSGNLGYWIGTPHRSQRYATTAALMCADIAFSELSFTRLEIVVLEHNEFSHRVAESDGATKEGLARNRLYLQGRPTDAIVYSLIPQDLVRNERVRGFTKPIGD